jgi:nucleoside-diphosphate-sugar epimerase
MKILIIGGGGYKGTKLVDYFLEKNFKVSVIDTFWFGNYLNKHKNLQIKNKDFRRLDDKDIKNHDAVIHLANIANDPMVAMNPEISWDINVLSTKILIEKCIKNKIKKFIYASSGSVYGVSEKKKVNEDTELKPISIYNKTKMIAERVLLSYLQSKTKIYIVRPATVCGFSKRMRLDLTVNLLTNHALNKKYIHVFGGEQIRPNIHINDMCRVYDHLICKKIKPDIYNAGFENLKVITIAREIKKNFNNLEIKVSKSNDIRSYRLDSSKIISTGFKPLFNVDYAIKELIQKRDLIKDQDENYNIKTMKKLKIS